MNRNKSAEIIGKQIKFNKDLVNKISEKEPYYLGLDIGTSSVGWAVSDLNYNIIKKSHKALWGSHLFTEGETAAERRLFREARRRRDRTNYRVKLLQEYFAPAISEVDPGFYQRNKDSFLYLEDKKVRQKNTLFNDEDYKDKDYHEEFPTIYHLRKELMDNPQAHDPRLVYLAVLHIMKNRGHFLYEGMEFQSNLILENTIKELNDLFESHYGQKLFAESEIPAVEKILVSDNNASDKNRELKKHLNDKDKVSKEFCKLIVGNKANFKNLFEEFDENEEHEIDYVKFSENKYSEDEIQESIEFELEAEEKDLLDKAFEIYNAVILQELLSDDEGNLYDSISAARIAIYKKHCRDLKTLKGVVNELKKKYDSAYKVYDKIFRENKKSLDNYVAYSQHVDSADDTSPENNCEQADFLKMVEKALKPYLKEKAVQKILDEKGNFKDDNFMPIIRSSANGVIPYQLHLAELEKILNNAKTYVKGLDDQAVEEIIQLFTFRVPYYIGPYDDRSKFSWIKRKNYESIRPWNFEDVVDVEATANAFIRNMTNKCSYLLGEDVLAKESLLYSEYVLRNQLNTITVNNIRLDKDAIDYLYEHLFLGPDANKKVTKKRIAATLSNRGDTISKLEIGGMDQDLPVKLKSRNDFNRIVGDKLSDAEIEDIIETITVFPDDKKMVRTYLKNNYSDKLNEEEIKKISNLSYKDWGRFSKKFLDGITTTLPDGGRYTIIDILRENPLYKNQPLNLMEILNKKEFNFQEIIKNENSSKIEEPNVVTESYLDDMRLSPAVKKAVFRVLEIVKEITKIMGYAPNKIFVEMAREKGVSRRTDSRKQRLEFLYKQSKKDAEIWSELEDLDEDKFRAKKLYLYALQKGRDIYSGERIDINELGDNSKYDIDHIYPRSLTKDDSWDNLVLTSQAINRRKGDDIVPAEFRKRQKSYWLDLLDSGFMSMEKYDRLTRSEPLSSNDIKGFINRQLVETRQSTKVISNVFERIFPKSKIIYVKAGLVTEFRYKDGSRDDANTKFFFPKLREVNDYHHAKDAYLNIVVGNVYDEKFTKNFWKRIDSGERRIYNLVKLYDHNISDNDGLLVWQAGNNGTIKTVKKMMNRNNIFLTHQPYRRSGGYYDQMIVKKGNGQYPIKTSIEALEDFDKYGAYNSVKISHYCIARYKNEKDKEKTSFLAVPVMLSRFGFSDESVIKFYENQGYSNIEILYKEIKLNQVINKNGVPYLIKSDNNQSIYYQNALVGKYNLKNQRILYYIKKNV